MDMRAIISVGVANGKNDSPVATGPLGSVSTLVSTNIGTHASSITGNRRFCVSFMSEQAAPTAMNSEPYISAASV